MKVDWVAQRDHSLRAADAARSRHCNYLVEHEEDAHWDHAMFESYIQTEAVHRIAAVLCEMAVLASGASPAELGADLRAALRWPK